MNEEVTVAPWKHRSQQTFHRLFVLASAVARVVGVVGVAGVAGVG